MEICRAIEQNVPSFVVNCDMHDFIGIICKPLIKRMSSLITIALILYTSACAGQFQKQTSLGAFIYIYIYIHTHT